MTAITATLATPPPPAAPLRTVAAPHRAPSCGCCVASPACSSA